MDDLSWMYRRLMDNCLHFEYIVDVRRFINFAFLIDKKCITGKNKCPYMRCKNKKFLKEDDIYKHQLNKAFLLCFENWIVHEKSCVIEPMLVRPS